MAGGDPREGFGSLRAGHLDESGSVRETSEQSDERVLVGCEFVGVVSGDVQRLAVVDQSTELAEGDDVARDPGEGPVDVRRIGVVVGDRIEDHERVGGVVAADVAALHVDAEHRPVAGADGPG